MTREEAITELSVLWERFNNGIGWRDGQYEEALDMAIEALQTQNISKSESYADDLISRADVKAEATKFFGHWVVFENRIDNLPSVSADYSEECQPNGWMPLPKPYREDGEDDGEN